MSKTTSYLVGFVSFDCGVLGLFNELAVMGDWYVWFVGLLCVVIFDFLLALRR
ncbi:MAG: hypothetical protein TU36_005420 [Vulcanisaeta sp. AZ3]